MSIIELLGDMVTTRKIHQISRTELMTWLRRQQVAKIFHSGMERMLVVYLRSLGSAMEDAPPLQSELSYENSAM